MRVGILGFGNFGAFAAEHLRSRFEVFVHDRRDLEAEARALGVTWAPFEDVVGCEVAVLAVPVQDMEEAVADLARAERLPEVVIEVASVKVKPLQILEEGLPASVEIVGLHPMFGPQSGRHGIAGLKVVLCPLRTTRVDCLRRLLEDELGLEVLEMSPAAHDEEMAYIQGLTHWIAKALREIKLPDLALATPAYRHLLAIEEILRDDSDALFRTIEAENPFAGRARGELVKRLFEIEEELGTSGR